MAENRRTKVFQPSTRIKIIKPPVQDAPTQTNKLLSPKHKKRTDHDEELLWTDEPTNMLEIPFKGLCQLNTPPKEQTPYDYFNMFVDNNYLDLIASETNLFAESTLKSVDKAKVQLPEWKLTTQDEMRIFLGLILHMGVIRLPHLSDYWKGDSLFRIPIFPRTMNQGRFLLLLKFLRFGKDGVRDQKDDTNLFQKVAHILEYFQNRTRKVYSAGKQLVIDGPIVFHNGRLIFENCVPGARHRNAAFRLYSLRDCLSGVILKIHISVDPVFDSGPRRVRQNEKIVTKLVEGFTGKGHSLYMDWSYNSLDLSQKLLTKFTYTTGPVKPDIEEIPPDSMLNRKLDKGESVACYTTSGLCVSKYKGRKSEGFFMVSSEQSHVILNCRSGKALGPPMPKVVAVYESYISRFDFPSDLFAYYPCENYAFTFYNKLGIHMLQLMVLNSYYLFNKYSGKKVDLYDFRMSIIKSMIPAEASIPVSPRQEILHQPKKTATLNGDDSSGPVRRAREQCKYCLSNGKKKTTIYYCPSCTGAPPLCLDPCFKIYHTA